MQDHEEAPQGPAGADEPHLVDPMPAAPTSALRHFLPMLAAVVGVAAICVAIVAFTSNDTDTSDAMDETSTDVAEPVEVDPVETCIWELSEWLPWITGYGSLSDAAMEWGVGSAEYDVLTTAWSVYAENLYQVGRSDASAVAYGEISKGCRAMPYAYEPGHLPPG